MNKRQSDICDMLARNGYVFSQELSEAFDVSRMTIHRDLAELESAGRLVRTHGGAMLARTGIVEFQFAEKSRCHTKEKQAIAAVIAGMVKPGMSVILDTGTTTLEVAKALSGIKGIKALTSSLAVASALYPNENVELVLLGGSARKNSPDLTGPLTEDNLSKFRVDLAVLGADALSREGAFTDDLNVARVAKAMIAQADKVVLAADSSKFKGNAFYKYADWRRFNRLVTDSGASMKVRKWPAKAGVEVICAKAK